MNAHPAPLLRVVAGLTAVILSGSAFASAREAIEEPTSHYAEELDLGAVTHRMTVSGALVTINARLSTPACLELSDNDRLLLDSTIAVNRFRTYGEWVTWLRLKGFKLAQVNDVTVISSPSVALLRSNPLDQWCPPFSYRGNFNEVIDAMTIHLIPGTKLGIMGTYMPGGTFDFQTEGGSFRNVLTQMYKHNGLYWTVTYIGNDAPLRGFSNGVISFSIHQFEKHPSPSK